MCTIVDAQLPTDQFALEETLSTVAGATIEMGRLVAHGSDRLMPFLWGRADDLDALSDALAGDPTTENVEVLTELEEENLYRMEWRARTRLIVHILIEEDGSIMDAYGENDRWKIQILFPEHDSVSATDEFCDEYGIDLDVKRVYQLSTSHSRGQYGLTDDQFETITRAYEAGYYDVPREAHLTDLASDSDVTHQALSERLRRGYRTLVENTLHPEVAEPAGGD